MTQPYLKKNSNGVMAWHYPMPEVPFEQPLHRNTYFHSGDLGDIIAALPIIRANGGGNIRLGPGNDGQREIITPERYSVIAPLLQTQSYIRRVMYGQLQANDINISAFRGGSTKLPGENLANWQARYMKVKVNLAPWLECHAAHAGKGRVIVARTARQQNPNFPWKRVIEHFGERCLFIGSPDECKVLESEVGRKIEFADTPNLLQAAALIMAAKYGYYNSSAPLWLALGLGTNIVEEVSPNEHVVFIPRPNAVYVNTAEDAEKIPLPTVKNEERVILLSAEGPPNARTVFAEKTWCDAEIHHLKIIHRDARDIGDERGCYYVKDLLDFSLMLSGDVFVYINNDVALVPEWKNVILPFVSQFGCAFGHRLEVKKFEKRLSLAECNADQMPYCGADIIAFTPAWWKAHRDNFPDAVLGYEGWDFVAQWLMRKSGFRSMPTVCYHEMHNSYWKDVLTTHPAQIKVRNTLVEWAKANGAEKYLWAPNGYLFKSMMIYE